MEATETTPQERFAVIVDEVATSGLKTFGAITVIKQLLLTASWVAGDRGFTELESTLIEVSNAVDEQQENE